MKLKMRAITMTIELTNEKNTFQSLALAFKIVNAYIADVSLPVWCQLSYS